MNMPIPDDVVQAFAKIAKGVTCHIIPVRVCDCCQDEEPLCPTCSSYMVWEDCWNGCDDGYFDLYDEDPLWYAEDKREICDICKGKGGYWGCSSVQCHETAPEPTNG